MGWIYFALFPSTISSIAEERPANDSLEERRHHFEDLGWIQIKYLAKWRSWDVALAIQRSLMVMVGAFVRNPQAQLWSSIGIHTIALLTAELVDWGQGCL